MTTDWRSWRRRVFILHTSPILRLEEFVFATLNISLWRTVTTQHLVGLRTVKLSLLKTGEAVGAYTSNLSIRTRRNRSRSRRPEIGCKRERRVQMANGTSPMIGRPGRISSTPQSLFRSCAFRLPAEPQKQYCRPRVAPLFPALGHLPTPV